MKLKLTPKRLEILRVARDARLHVTHTGYNITEVLAWKASATDRANLPRESKARFKMAYPTVWRCLFDCGLLVLNMQGGAVITDLGLMALAGEQIEVLS